MTIRHLVLAAGFATAALAAQATVVVNANGNVTTYTESFDGGTSFSSGWFDAQSSDDFLSLQGVGQTASFSFSSAVPLQSLTVEFWYQVPADNNGTVQFETSGTLSLPHLTGTPAQFLVFNPGPSSPAASHYSATVNNLAAGVYTVSFATNGVLKALKVDDVLITATAAIPEPGTYALMAVGLAMVGWAARRRRPLG